jgi:outer membrane lipoprotein-sorting protein
MRNRAPLFVSLVIGACAATALAATSNAPSLSAEQIVDKHVAARGGLNAWRSLQSLAVKGKLDAGSGDSIARSRVIAQQGAGASGRRAQRAAAQAAAKEAAAQQVQLPFRLEVKRPRKSRLEIDFAGKTAVQVYDGQNGWKSRPYLNRDDVEPFSADEAKWEATRADLEGPLVDYAAKGTQIALEGMEPVDGHNAYKLKLTLKSGDVQRIWIDAKSFLDVKVEGIPRRMDGKTHSVFVAQHDFRSVKGLMMPYELVSTVEGYPGAHKMMIESVTVNPALDEAIFSKPQAPVAAAPSAPVALPVPAAAVKATPAKS